MRISQRQTYPKSNKLFDVSYLNIMLKISKFLNVPLRYRDRIRKNGYSEQSYEVRSANFISNYTILSYLLKYPLFSYKYKEILVQIELLRLSLNKYYKKENGLTNLENLKIMSKGYNKSKKEKLRDHYLHILKYFPF